MKLIAIAALLVLFAAALAGTALLVSGPFLWMDVLFLCRCRSRLAIVRLGAVMLAIWIPLALFLPLGEGTILGFLMALFLAPWPARRWILASAWARDDSATRQAAMALRQGINRRAGIDRTIGPDRPWPEYMHDVVRSDPAVRYDPSAVRGGTT